MSELILIVDDEPGILSTLAGILSDEGYATMATTSGEEALTLYAARRPAVADRRTTSTPLPARAPVVTAPAL